MRLVSIALILLFLASCAPEGKFTPTAVVQNTNAELEQARKEIKELKEKLISQSDRNDLDLYTAEKNCIQAKKEVKAAVDAKNGCYYDLNYWKNLAQKQRAVLTAEQLDKLDTFYSEPEDESGIYSDEKK
jgi:hypothetical protein